MSNIREITKVEFVNGYWTVQILSAATGRWIIQGEWATEAEAQADRRNWL